MKRHMKVRPGLAVFLVACIEVGISVQGKGSKESRRTVVCFAGFTDLVTSNRDSMYVMSLNSALKKPDYPALQRISLRENGTLETQKG